MQIRSLLSKKKIIGTALCIVGLTIIAFLFLSVSRTTSELSYHQSQWNEYAPQIEQARRARPAAQPLALKHVYGGVVSHHIPTTIPKLVEFYSRLKQTQSVKKFIIIGPDHTSAGKAPITVSKAAYLTTYGTLQPIPGLASQLEDAGIAVIDESPFDQEHSVGSQILMISSFFPDANVTPILVRSDASKEQAEMLGRFLARSVDDDTVVIDSVDFSHYLTTNRARPLDHISGDIVRNLDIKSLPLVNADSNESLEIFMRTMLEKQATATDDFSILNTNDLMQNSDYTTGYVFGFWGIK